MTIDADISLGELVTQRPELAPALEDLGLDYCCGGTRTVAQACQEAGLALDEVVAGLDAQPRAEPADWASMGPVALVDHLEATHHAYLGQALPRLTALMEKVLDVHGPTHPELRQVAACLRELRLDLEPHLMKEEQILFPMVRELYDSEQLPEFHCGTLQNPIRVMEMEHDRAGELLARLRNLTSAFTAPDDGCASYDALYAGLAELEADTHLHIHKENNLLFGAVVAEERRRARSVGADRE